MPHRKIIWQIFFAALAIRWAYAITLYTTMGPDGLLGMDSRGFVQWVHDYGHQIRAGTLQGWHWLSVNLSIMPLVSWSWVVTELVFGKHLAIAYVLFQGVIDSLTCLLVYGLARSFRADYAAPAGIFAAINPTQIVMSGLFYTDAMFLFFIALMLFAAVRWLNHQTWTWAVLLGLALGGAGLSRILVFPWAFAVLGFFAVVTILRRTWSRTILAQLVATGAIFMVCISPVLTRNIVHYGTLSLTPQAGVYQALWLAPLVRQAHDGTPWARGTAEMQKKIDAAIGTSISNPFELSRRYSEIGMETMRHYGWGAMLKAWVYGAAINLGSPALLLSPPVISLPRTGFYDTPGASMPDKIRTFLFRSDNALYAWLLLAGVAGVAIIRLLQLAGITTILVRDGVSAPLLLLSGWVAFILLVNGPIASPKYRLPLEPVFSVMSAAGYATIRDWYRRRRSARA
jgi:4-amino-4-deoxy-L-arabinose transferase-like glycosyltransferase